jgi:hypothetical protein
MSEIEIPPEVQRWLPWTAGSGPGARDDFYILFKKILYQLVEQQQPMTVRQVFYRCVVKGWVEKTEKGYGFVQRNLANMRRERELPYSWVVDESRRMRGSQGFPSKTVEEFMEDLDVDAVINKIADEYWTDLLGDLDFSIQIWLEKEALLGVVEPVTTRWGVPLCPAKGYSSLSFLYKASRDLESRERPAKLFYFGDYDPSGQDAIQSGYYSLRSLATNTKKLGLDLTIVAVKPEQIEEMALPTRPTKQSDTRAGSFGDESVELDAIEPDVLRQMVEDTIAECFPPGVHEECRRRVVAAQEEVRRRLRAMFRLD